MSNEILKEINYLYSHTSPETAYVVLDYPWGFRLRTTIRYWIESKDSKNGGQRFASQTIDPKTGRWCKPKYSTYSAIKVMFLDENDHIKVSSLGYYDDEKSILNFKDKHFSNMSEFQKDQLRLLVAQTNVMKHVTFTITKSEMGPVSLFSRDPEEVRKRELLSKQAEGREVEQRKVMNNINRAIAHEYVKNKTLIA